MTGVEQPLCAVHEERLAADETATKWVWHLLRVHAASPAPIAASPSRWRDVALAGQLWDVSDMLTTAAGSAYGCGANDSAASTARLKACARTLTCGGVRMLE